MLTIFPLKSVAKTVDYFQSPDNYYVKDGIQGVWFGEGAKLLNLEGDVKSKDFVSVLKGKLSTDITMETTTKKRRLGYDLTFSAPKSVSILALIGKDERVLNAHRKAVDATLKYIEEHYAATRVKREGETSIENTGNLLLAKFEHIETRELDPGLHTHSTIMNATYRSDQKWRTLHFDEVYDDKKLLDAIYIGQLVQYLMQSGYEITQTSEKATFELKGFAEHLIKNFSKRRQQIEAELEKKGLSGGKAAQIANFNTRKDKQKIDLKELEARWVAELQQCDCSLEWLKDYSDKALARGPVLPPNPYYLANQAITKAAKELGEWHSVFTIKKLKELAGGLSISNYSPMLLDKVIADQFKNGELLSLTNDLCTTQTSRDLEMLNVINMKQGRNKIFPMFSKLAANYLVTKAAAKESQETLKILLTNTDREIVVTAKNAPNYVTTMHSFIALSVQYGFRSRGITQTFKRTAEMSEELGLKRVQTIKGFLMSCAIRAEKIKEQPIPSYNLPRAKQIWILDFHSSISASQLNEIQNYAKEFGARIIWANKVNKPQAAINALINFGIKQCNLDKDHSKTMSALTVHPTLNNSIDVTHNPITKDDWQTSTADALLHWATHKYQQHNAVFALKDLQLELFSLGLTVSKEVLQSQLDLALKQKSLIDVQDQSGELITTKETINLEQACLRLVTNSKNTVAKIVDEEKILLPKHLTKGQQAAINLTLTTQDRVIGIQGIAGAGKTTMLRSLNQLCKDANFEIIGLTPTTAAKERVQDGSKNLTSQDLLLKAGIKTLTTRKFLIDSEKLLNKDPTLAKLEYGTNKLLVLDEASFVSTAEMLALLTKVIQLNTRIIVMGDNKQLSSVENGRIFYLMLGSEMVAVVMKENVRFKTVKALTVMQHIYKNQISQALERLGDSLIEIPDHQERLMKMAELYLQKTPEEQQNTLLITPEHSDRKLVNQLIRQGLQTNGQLTGSELACHNLTQVKLTKAEQQKIFYFQAQDFIVFFKIPNNFQAKINEYYQVTLKNLEDRTLTLEDLKTREQLIWSPEDQTSVINVYRQEERKLMQNDRIRWLQNNETLGICNGQTAIVLAVDNTNATFKLQNDQTISLDLAKLANQHWDHAYAATTFVAQGADQQAIALAKGAYYQELTTKKIKINDVLMAKVASESNKVISTWVHVVEINKDYIAKAQDRDGNILTIDLKQSPIDLYIKNQAIWQCCFDPETRKKSEIPKLTSVSEFLVSVTRGDKVIVLVDHIESYEHALKQRITGARSAMEYLDPNKKEVRAKVDQMTANITGQAIEDTKEEHITDHKPDVVKNSLYKNHKVTIEQVIDKLHSNILQHATNWLGQPQKVMSNEARWGKKGSLVVKLSGEKAGYWHDFESGKGGKNLLSLYTERFNRDFKTAINELSNALYIDPNNKLFAKTATISAKQSSTKVTTLDFKKIKYINKVYDSGVAIFGTLAEKYLREFRCITGNIPNDFRFCAKLKHPDLNRFVPALLAPIKNKEDQIQGIVRIFLNKDGGKLNSTYIDNNGNTQSATVKANLGSVVNAAVVINQGNNNNTIYIAEGIETALSIAQAKPAEKVVAALSVSNLKNVPLLTETQKVVLCADYDGANAISTKALLAAANFYKERGLQVAIAYPENIPGMSKVDFNDVLKHLGTLSITRSLQNANVVPQKLPEVTKAMELNNLSTTKMPGVNKELTR